jgi:Tfp pilus assembly protein PilO
MPHPGQDPMRKLSPTKRNHLIIVLVLTLGALFAVFHFLIDPQKAQNKKLAENIRAQRDKLQSIKNAIKDADHISSDLTTVSFQLGRAEEDVASGDVYAWIYDTIRRFKSAYKVEIPTISAPTVTDADLFSGFPYRQVKVTLSGVGFYHDIGKFVADFENNFPHMRMVNLLVEPANQVGPNAEKLSFRVDVIALVKPNT